MDVLVKISHDLTVSGRELHEFLGVETPYLQWFERMCEYGFEEGIDHYTFLCNGDGFGKAETRTDHQMTIDMAKEIAMLQRTDKGKQVRRYFLEVEKRYRGIRIEKTDDYRRLEGIGYVARLMYECCDNPDYKVVFTLFEPLKGMDMLLAAESFVWIYCTGKRTDSYFDYSTNWCKKWKLYPESKDTFEDVVKRLRWQISATRQYLKDNFFVPNIGGYNRFLAQDWADTKRYALRDYYGSEYSEYVDYCTERELPIYSEKEFKKVRR
jgi:phage anti-repressor protein